MSGHLIVVDKGPDVFPVDIRETWRIFFSKCMLMVTGPEAINACQDDQLCSIFKAGINGAIHGVQVILGDN